MPIVSNRYRSHFLNTHYPTLSNLCIKNSLPAILTHRINTHLPFCYGRQDGISSIPASWDSPHLEVIPLWEDSLGITAICVDGNDSSFIDIPFEDPDDITVTAKTTDGLFFVLFYFLVESLGGPDEKRFREIQDLANTLEFEKLDLVVHSVERFSSEPNFDKLFWELSRSI